MRFVCVHRYVFHSTFSTRLHRERDLYLCNSYFPREAQNLPPLFCSTASFWLSVKGSSRSRMSRTIPISSVSGTDLAHVSSKISSTRALCCHTSQFLLSFYADPSQTSSLQPTIYDQRHDIHSLTLSTQIPINLNFHAKNHHHHPCNR